MLGDSSKHCFREFDFRTMGGREGNRQPDSQSDRQAKLRVDSNLAEVVIAQVASASNVFRQRNAPLQDGCPNGKYKCWASNSEEEEDEE